MTVCPMLPMAQPARPVTYGYCGTCKIVVKSGRPCPLDQHTFDFKIGDRVVSRGIDHWTNTEPLIICTIGQDHFGGRQTPDGYLFTYAKGGPNGLHWITAPEETDDRPT
jgi:hypothetical protein